MAVKCILTGQTPSVLDGVTENVQTQLNDKVDKVTGKGLSTNDYTDAEKTKLSGIEAGAQKNTITGVKGSAETTYRTGNVNITATNIGLGNVNNTSDAEKPISTATKTALDGKQANITGAATTITNDNLTANRALISNSSGKVAVSSVTSTELGYLDGVTSNIQTQLNSKLSSAPVTSVNNKTGAVTLAKGDVGLGNVDNTSDANKPISNATQAALNDKQSKITANGILKGDGSGNIIAASETEVELVSLPNICNPNLLDNWYFGKPVNQRGQARYTGTMYCIDRWIIGGDNPQLTVTSGSIKGVGYLLQKAEVYTTSSLEGMQLTLSALMSDNTFGSVTFHLSKGMANPIAISKNDYIVYAEWANANDYFSVNWKTDSEAVGLVAVKLELGSQQTLAHQENGKWVLNEIPDYGEQLRRCQRYYYRKVSTGSYSQLLPVASNNNGNTIAFCLPAPLMRVNPSIQAKGTLFCKTQKGNVSIDVTDKELSVRSNNIGNVIVTLKSNALGANAYGTGVADSFEYSLSADI